VPAPFTPSRLVPRVVWHPDKWERISLIARLVEDLESVVDVGGRGRELAKVLPGASVISANVEQPADVLFDGDRLPFDDAAFDAATSCDVIEHIPAERRLGHLRELLRVSRRRVVVCCPLGTDYHRQAEHDLQRWLVDQIGSSLDFLDEHLQFGIPDQGELAGLVAAAAPGATVTWRFHGDVDEGNDLLKDGVRARWRRDPVALARYLRAAYLVPRRPTLDETARPSTNRVFVVIDRELSPAGGAATRRAGTPRPAHTPQPSPASGRSAAPSG
jgi:hypothetical protein